MLPNIFATLLTLSLRTGCIRNWPLSWPKTWKLSAPIRTPTLWTVPSSFRYWIKSKSLWNRGSSWLHCMFELIASQSSFPFRRYKTIASYRGLAIFKDFITTLQNHQTMIAEKVTNKILDKVKDNLLYEFVLSVCLCLQLGRNFSSSLRCSKPTNPWCYSMSKSLQFCCIKRSWN